MKKKFWIVAIMAVVLGLMGALVACNNKVTVELNKSTIDLTVGEKTTLVATASDGSDITWASDNTAVASVSTRGVVTGVSAGTAKITATSGTATAECTVTVKDAVKITFKDAEGNELEKIELERDGTVQLSATTSDGSTITSWTSYDESTATVSSTGLVTGVWDGETKISVKTSSNATATIDVSVSDDNYTGVKYTLPDAAAKEAGKWWFYTASDNGKNFTVNRKEYRGGVVTFDFEGTNYYYTDVQLGLANSSESSVGWHKVNVKIESNFAGAVTILETRVDLVEGLNDVTVAFNQEEGADSFHMYFANTKANSFITSGRVTISEIEWVDFTPVDLVTPSFALSDGNVTITDTANAEGVAEYEIGLFEENGAVPVFSQKFDVNGGKLDTSTITKAGTYFVKLRVIGNVGYTDSAWTANEVKIEVDNGDVSYEISNNGQSAALTSGKWEGWAGDGGSTTKREFVNGIINVEGHTSSWAHYGIQLFRHYDQYPNGTKLAITMTVTTDVAGKYEVSGTVVDLPAGTTTFTVYKLQAENNATIVFLFGANPQADNPLKDQDVKLSISDVEVEVFTDTIKLVAPGSMRLSDSKELTFTDADNENGSVTRYEVGFFADAEAETPIAILVMASGDTLDDSKITDGEYILKIRAVSANIRYETSDWSSETLSHTVAHGEIVADTFEPDFSQEMLTATNEDSTPNDRLSLWWVEDTSWNCGSVVTMSKSVDSEKKEITATYSGGDNDWSVQFFYKHSGLRAGTQYKLTLKINASKAMNINVNGTAKSLVEGDNDIEVTVTGGSGSSLKLVLGQQSADSVTVKISDILWTEILA